MKNLFFALLFLLPALSFGQRIGEYVLSIPLLGGNTIIFLENNRFEYQYTACAQRAEGFGFYRIKNGFLILNFETDPNMLPSEVRVNKTPTESDSISVNITVLDATMRGEPLFSAAVTYNGGVDGNITDFDGKVRFKFLKSKDSDSLTFSVSYIGFEDAKITIAADQNYTLSFFLADNFIQHLKTGDIHKYRIRNIKKDSFELKSDYKNAKFELYKRRKKSEK